MRHGLRPIAALILGAIAACAVGSAGAATATGPYYATPSWSQKLPASTRFIVLSNWNSEAVLDRETGLVWERMPSTDTLHSWAFALVACRPLIVGDRRGWRLPSVEELSSLFDGATSPPAGHPFQGINGNSFWTTSSYELSVPGNQAYGVQVGASGVFAPGVFADFKQGEHYAWCVRGGSSAVNPTE